MAEDTEIVKCALVLVGKFNPAIFSPAWFSKFNIITDREFEVSETEVIVPQLSKFSVEHLSIQCEVSRFQISWTSEPTIRVLDTALQIFGDLLPHTPLNAFGVNYAEHWRADSWQRRTALGRALAPTTPWGSWGATFDAADADKVGGMTELSVHKPFDDDVEGFLRATIGPSPEIADKNRGIVLNFNHHRQFEVDDVDGTRRVLDRLSQEFDPAIRRAKGLIQELRDFSKSLEIQS